MNPILITIVTVVKNAKDNLEKTILSLRQQTYKSIEYIVIDGASNDGTLETIKANTDIISKWLSEKDKGIYDAMNKGLKLATGDFVIYINAGDNFSDNTVIEEMCSAIDKDRVANINKLCFGKVTIFNHDTAWEYKPYDHHDNSKYLPHHQSVFYPKIFYTQEQYDPEYRIMGDGDLTLRAIKVLDKLYVPKTIVRSEFSGYGAMIYRNLKGVNVYIKDLKRLHDHHPTAYNQGHIVVIYIKAYFKYILFKIGGPYLINKMIAFRLNQTGARAT